MAVLTSLYSGISGLNANGAALSVIGNNIANVNTVGFKASRASFADVLNGAAGDIQIGRGTYLSDVSSTFTQGSLEVTSNGLDLGIDGDGFFLVRDSSGSQFYSRAGQFSIDKEGLVVNNEGLHLQGYQTDSAGNVSGTIDNINISSNTTSPNITSAIQITANMDSTVSPVADGFDINNITDTSHFSTALSVYDSLGNEHVVSVYFTKIYEDTAGETGNYWQWNGVADGVGGTSVMARGYLQFDPTGALVAENIADMDITLNDPPGVTNPTGVDFPDPISSFNFNGGVTQGQPITFDFGTGTANGGSGLDGTTQFGTASVTLFQTQDGYSSGSLKSLNVNQNGTISGLYTNGQTRVVGQVALGMFNNPQGLIKMGKNLFAESYDSGQVINGAPDKGGRGRLLSSSLELSNVDLAEEFIKLITIQRGFQANSKVITTTDEMLNDLINLKR
ncbi:MAG: flagellar hook protein FlgE [Nitrospirae bacterium]|nr:flagellar hook protein FlgE [Nitrospirota bacterium]